MQADSAIAARIKFNSETTGLLICAIEDSGRIWKEDEKEFCSSIAQLLFQVFSRLEGKRVERNLKASEKKFRRLVENAKDLIYRMSLLPHLSFEYVSPSAEKITGYTPEEFYADPYLLFKIIYPEDLPLINQTEGDYSGETVTMRVKRKNGDISWVELKAVQDRDENGDIIAIDGIFRDVSERIEADNALRISQQKFKSVFDNASVGIAVHKEDEKVINVNRAIMDFLGYPEEEFTDLYYEDLVHPEDMKSERLLLRDLHAGRIDSFHNEKRYLRKDGKTVWGRTNISLSRDTSGKPLNFITVI